MAVAGTLLTSSYDNVDRGSPGYAFASVSPAANSLLVVGAFMAATTTAGTPSISDTGGNTWTTRITDLDGGRSYAVFTAQMGASPGSITITLWQSGGDATHTGAAWSVVEVTGHDSTAPVVQTQFIGGDGTTNTAGVEVTGALPYALVAARTNNRAFSFWQTRLNEAITPRTNWTELSEDLGTGPNSTWETQWRNDGTNEATFGATWATGTIRYAGMAIEISSTSAYPYIVDHAGAALTTNDPSVTFAATYVPKENDIIALFISSATVLGVQVDGSLPSGWVNPLGSGVEINSDAHGMGVLYHKVTAAEETAVTLTYTATDALDAAETGYVEACAIRNVDPTTPVDGANTAQDSGNTVTPHVLASITGSGVLLDGSIVVSSVAKDGTGTYTTPSGWSLIRTDNTNNGRWLGVRNTYTVVDTNVAATNITPSAGDEYCSITIAWKAEPAGNVTAPVSTITSTTGLPTFTISASQTAPLSTITATTSLPTIGIAIAVTAGLTTITAATLLPTFTIQASQTAPVSTVTSTTELPTFTVSGGATAPVATVTSSTDLPTITISVGGGDVTAPVSTVTATTSLPTIGIAAAATAPVATVTSATLLPTFTVSGAATAPVATVTATTSLPTIGITAAATAPVSTVTSGTLLPTFTVSGAAIAPVATVTSITGLPTIGIQVAGSATAPVTTITATTALPTIGIQASQTAPVATITATTSLPTIGISAAAAVQLTTLTVTTNFPGLTVTTTGNVTAPVATLTSTPLFPTFTITTVGVFGTVNLTMTSTGCTLTMGSTGCTLTMALTDVSLTMEPT
jgi:hypothetical protein